MEPQNTTHTNDYHEVILSGNSGPKLLGVMILVLLLMTSAGLLFTGCKSTKMPGATESNQPGAMSNVQADQSSLFTAENMDTLSALTALAGEWQLTKVCQSTYAGLKCDTTKTMLVKVDVAGNIAWEKDGQTKLSDKLQFVKRGGAGKGDSVWVLSMAQNDEHSYLVQKLQNDTLRLAEYPLIMDKTTTYYLHK